MMEDWYTPEELDSLAGMLPSLHASHCAAFAGPHPDPPGWDEFMEQADKIAWEWQ